MMTICRNYNEGNSEIHGWKQASFLVEYYNKNLKKIVKLLLRGSFWEKIDLKGIIRKYETSDMYNSMIS